MHPNFNGCELVLLVPRTALASGAFLFIRFRGYAFHATEQELRGVVVELPGESVSFGTVPAGDYALMKIRRRMPQPDFVPSQRGTLADGTSIEPQRLSSGEGVPIKRVVYTVRSDGTLWARVESGAK